MTKKAPYKVHIEANKVYSWCSCGFSTMDPFCDGSHREKSNDKRSVKFQSDLEKDVFLCGCKETKNPPYCDGSHHNQS